MEQMWADICKEAPSRIRDIILSKPNARASILIDISGSLKNDEDLIRAPATPAPESVVEDEDQITLTGSDKMKKQRYALVEASSLIIVN